MSWNDLPLSDKARMMQLAVNSGITDLRTIQEVYNEFAEGGEKPDSNLTQAQKDSLIARVNTSNADFVKRLQDENRKYIDYGDSIATHRMAYATDENGNAIVYPEVQSVGDTLQWFRGWDAYDRAVSRGDTLQMSIPEAEWFTTNYKKYYPKGKTFAEGGGIHIKPSHRGKFTALKERTGHSASWFKAHGTPAQKKMATFALNARKWHHADGGFLNEVDYGFLESPNIFEKGGKKKKIWDHSISWYISHYPEKYPTFSKIKDLSLLDKYYTINDDGVFESNKDRYYKKSKQVRNSTGRIDYNKDNEIMLTTSGANARYRTGKISTDILDYIYDNAAKANIPLKEAIGLAGKESTLGIGRGYKAGAYISPIDLYSYWNGVGDATITNSQQKKLNSVYERLFKGEDVSDKELMEAEKQYEKMYNNLHDYEGDNLVRDAYNYYKAGKYNPGEKGYNDSVLIQGDAILQDKAVQNWLKTKKPYKGRGF